MPSQRHTARTQVGTGYTLIEVLVVIVVMGIAGALVIPAVGSSDVLRTQTAVRTLISDLSFAQSDAIALQQQRAVEFDTDENQYRIRGVSGTTLLDVVYDPFSANKRYELDFDDPDFGGAVLTDAEFGTGAAPLLVFDEFGAPVDGPGSVTPIPSGFIEITGPRFIFTVTVDGMTGQINTDRVAN
ncbi:MAG: prepilin-type N-terminal cleavage/methylation domain-containing protein [Planctomycetota bacterium]